MNRKISYVPIVKAKEGELQGISVLSDHVKDQIAPLFEIPNVPWDYEQEIEAKTVEKHFDKLPSKIKSAIQAREFFLESRHIDEDRLADNGNHHFSYIIDLMKDLQINPIPVLSMDRSDLFKQSVKNVHDKYATGICLRVSIKELSHKGFLSQVRTLLEELGLLSNDVYLLIDLKVITSNNSDLVIGLLRSFFGSNDTFIEEWKNVILAGTAFPIDLSAFTRNSVNSISRVEWEVYKELMSDESLSELVFGDYTVSSTESTEIDPRLLTMSASVRYTVESDWVIYKGQSTKAAGFGQYHALCKHIIGTEQYYGKEYSWGDKYIFDCGNNEVTSGNATTWRKVANNHHIEVVVHQLANLSVI